MKMPNNYEQTKIGGDYIPIALGGHHLIIKKVEETQSKAGKPMLKVFFDTSRADSQPEFFANEFRNDIRPDKKWPRNGTAYILVEDNDGNCSRNFKRFITSFEHSNGVESIWGDKFAAQFKDKRIGGIFGEVENEYNGKVTMRHELRWFCSDDKADSASVPEPKLLSGSTSTTSTTSSDGFMDIPDGAQEELPF
jgi:hypothetical protein